MVKPVLQRRSGDAPADGLQSGVADALRTIAASPFASMRVIPDVSFASGSTVNVDHGLGRAPTAWWIASPSAHMVVWQQESRSPTLYLTLVSSADGVAHVIVL